MKTRTTGNTAGVRTIGWDTVAGATGYRITFEISNTQAVASRGCPWWLVESLGAGPLHAATAWDTSRAGASLAMVFGATTAGKRIVTSTSSLSVGFGVATTSRTSGVASGSVVLPVSVGVASAGSRIVLGAAAMALALGADSTATTTSLAAGAASLKATLTVSTEGTRGTAGAVSLPVTFGASVTGASVNIVTASASLGVTLGPERTPDFNIVRGTDSITWDDIATTYRVTFWVDTTTAIASRKSPWWEVEAEGLGIKDSALVWGPASSLTLSIGSVTQGSVTSGVATVTGAASLGLGLGVVSSGKKILLGSAALPVTISVTTVGAVPIGTQYARPDGNITNDGTNGFAAIDEATASDSDFWYGPNNTASTLEVSLSNVTDPSRSTGHTFRYRIAKVQSGVLSGTGSDVTVTASLVQGTTVIATDTARTATGTWTTYTRTLSGTEADAITDYTDLRLRFVTSASGGSPSNRRGAAVSWAELELA